MTQPSSFLLERGARGYPAELARLADPPEVLRVRGVIPSLARAVAIVGTRGATERGLRVARTLAAELAKEGCVIVSGGAFGVDHAAHLGALDAKGATVVVHASGLGATYPAEHRPLYARIVERGGCEMSEREDEAAPRPRFFLARNRIIAGLARVVIVVEAPSRSGALSTAAYARAIDVPVMAVPRVPECPEALGSNDLIRAGALPCMAARDALRRVEETPFLPFTRARERTDPRMARQHKRSVSAVPRIDDARASLDPLARALLAAIEEGADELEAIVDRLGRPLPEVLAGIADLELRGLVVQGRRGTFEVVG